MEILNSIRQDLKKSLSFSDEPGVLESMMNHIEEQCTKEEQELIEERIMDISIKEYESYAEFIEDYQPIFDLVDFPIAQCVRHFDRRKFTEEDLDRFMNSK